MRATLLLRCASQTRLPSFARPILPPWASAFHCSASSSRVRAFSTKSTRHPDDASPSFAFAFDIDGVLLHSSRPLPGARETLSLLESHHLPYILLTNGGGYHETERAQDLSTRLGIPISADHLVQSHTPYQDLALTGGAHEPEPLADKTVLVIGADPAHCRTIAHRYGFRSVVTPADILTAEPSVFPFKPVLDRMGVDIAPLPGEPHRPDANQSAAHAAGGEGEKRGLKIDAILVFNDSRDWAVDTQVIMDLLLSEEGYLGTYSRLNGDPSLPNCGWQQHDQPTLYFSHDDLYWATGYHLPRFGQGAFHAALAGLWRRITGGTELRSVSFGKPSVEAYAHAESLLHANLAAHGHDPAALKTIYMIGDNPESDIVGSNTYRQESSAHATWEAVLVHTGVWNADRDGGVDALMGLKEPRAVMKNVSEAVAWAIERERKAAMQLAPDEDEVGDVVDGTRQALIMKETSERTRNAVIEDDDEMEDGLMEEYDYRLELRMEAMRDLEDRERELKQALEESVVEEDVEEDVEVNVEEEFEEEEDDEFEDDDVEHGEQQTEAEEKMKGLHQR